MDWMPTFISVLSLLIHHSIGNQDQSSIVPEQHGIIDWIANLIGTTTTTLRPVNDPPEDCPSCECGRSRYRSKIVGGQETKKLQFPWMAVLLDNNRFYCGGSLINDLYVLTAAHCTVGFLKERMSVRFLEHNQAVPNETRTIERRVSAIIRHLRYNPATIDNDIALLKLDQRVNLSQRRKRVGASGKDGDEGDDDDIGLSPVCLPTPDLMFTNYSAVVSGWGTTEEGGDVSDTLQEVCVPIITNEECNEEYGEGRITDNMMCAGIREGGKDACQGDSGGPLHIYNTTTSRYDEVGIVSWGNGCARPNYAGVYTRVNRYRSWIQRNTKDACYCQ